MIRYCVMMWAAVAAVLCSVSAVAEPLKVFPMASVESDVTIKAPNHHVLLSPVREVNDEIRADRQFRLDVVGHGRLMEIDPDSSLDRVGEFYREAMAQRSGRTLFTCSGRDCGRSNVWANRVFHQATLYGRDEDQSYAAYSYRDEAGTLQLVLLYSITRGNQRDYVWLEELAIQDESEVANLSPDAGRILGPLQVSWTGNVTYRFDWDAEAREKLVGWAGNPGATVMIVSHVVLGMNETVKQALERSARVADTMQALLEKLGIPREQQLLINAGPAQSAIQSGRSKGNRLEIVVIKDVASGGG
ncbi:DUF4892 domain-containing protein [Marinobacter halodurans]|uniref:DUF4892 domain-containing protein n=1 Tax=Marinobacter halodurans TaxID=2528979 RepID=A0ABY1ZN40_9GAMM|nr:DUF4892 domain-containing protein [Marinobacter halodurans]TBW54736.1 DUF4892 domain-containing protein [Marinobacter halodurans]